MCFLFGTMDTFEWYSELKLLCIIIISLELLNLSNATQCLECINGVKNPSFCGGRANCSTGESCYAEYFIQNDGTRTFYAGCRSTYECKRVGAYEMVTTTPVPSSIQGRRGVTESHIRNKRRVPTGLPACAMCCDNFDYCNQYSQCQYDTTKSTGIYCLQCDHVSHPDKCNKITMCDSDQECFTEKLYTGIKSDPIAFRLGCLYSQMCKKYVEYEDLFIFNNTNLHRRGATVPPSKGFSHKDAVCTQCCNSSYCNGLETCGADVCSPNPCQNGGKCIDQRGLAFCDCKPGYTGRLCTDVCSNTTVCANGGTCVSVQGVDTCICRPEFQGPTCTEKCTVQPTDVVFLLDSSRSLGQANFSTGLRFVGDVVRSLKIGPNNTQVGLLTYSDVATLAFQLSEHSSQQEILADLATIKFIDPTHPYTGASSAPKALQFVREHMLDSQSGHRSNAKTVIIMLSDGNSGEGAELEIQVRELKKSNPLIITIGMGNMTTLSAMVLGYIASDKNHTYRNIPWSQLTSLQQDIVQVTCVSTSNSSVNGTTTAAAAAITSRPTSQATATKIPATGTTNPNNVAVTGQSTTSTTVRSTSKRQHTQQVTISVPTAAPNTGLRCFNCSGFTCKFGLAKDIVQCPGDKPYCMNTFEKDAGNKTPNVFKQCVNLQTCREKWLQQTSDVGKCVDLIADSTQRKVCHFCCLQDECNKLTQPPAHTLFREGSPLIG